MSVKDILQQYESLAWQIQEFIWEGKPYKSKKKRAYSRRILGVPRRFKKTMLG